MKKVLALVLFAGLAVIPAMAQAQQGNVNLASPSPQFIAFNFGVPIGVSFAVEGKTVFMSGYNFGMDFAILDNLTIGIDHNSLSGKYEEDDGFGGTNTVQVNEQANLLRLSFAFANLNAGRLGAAFGFGQSSATNLAVSLGAFGNFMQGRSQMGIAYSLGLRVDYIAPADDLKKGTVAFVIRTSLGI